MISTKNRSGLSALRHIALLALGGWAALALQARAAGISGWELPPGGVASPEARTEWKAAAKGAAPQAGAALENKQFLLIAQPGQPAAVLYTKPGKGQPGPATRLELALLVGDVLRPLQAVSIPDLQAGEGTLRLVTAELELDLTLQRGQAVVGVRAAKGSGALEVRARSRYTVVPDFSGQDLLYDPRHFKGERLGIAAENFFLSCLEGQRTLLMCLWPAGPGEAKEGGGATAPRQDVPVELVLDGVGESRRAVATRIGLPAGPLHLAVMERDGLWAEQTVGGWKAQEPGRLAWRRPFNAEWRVSLLAPEGRLLKEFLTRSQSCNFLAAPSEDDLKKGLPAKDPEAARMGWGSGLPLCFEESLQGRPHPAWFKGEEAYLVLGQDLPRGVLPENVDAAAQGREPQAHGYERAVCYPSNRKEDTPLDVFTPIDILRNVLGEKPCDYILDLGGGRKLLAESASATWATRIAPLQAKADVLTPEERALLARALKELALHLQGGPARLEGYRQSAEKLRKQLTAGQSAGPAQAAAGALAGMAAEFLAGLGRFNLPGAKVSVAQWEKTLLGIAGEVEGGNGRAVEKAAGVREVSLAQDTALSFCRRGFQALRHQAAFQEGSGPEVRRFIAEIRAACLEALRGPPAK